MFHYLEYEFHGARYHTRRSGPLNDLEGNGLLCEIKKRNGVILMHKQGTREQIAEIISYYAEKQARETARTFEHAKQFKRK